MEPDAPLLVTSQALQLGHSNLLLLITLFTKAVAFGKRGEVNGFLGIRKSRVEAEKDERREILIPLQKRTRDAKF